MIGLVDIAKVSNLTGQDENHLNHVFNLVKDEAKQTLKLIRGMSFSDEARILEVGAGYGLASICLAMLGFSVTALEPGGTGFEDYAGTSSSFAEMCNVEINHLDTRAEETIFPDILKFDLIISNNVLEHIGQIEGALLNLNSALKRDGMMVHSCPNYAFPFEPHFGIPLVPIFPKFTRYLLPKGISISSLWASLNFVSARQLKNFYKNQGLYLAFRKGTMISTISRFRDEEIFAARHPILKKVFSNNLVFKTTRKLFNVPIHMATPMDFIVCFPEREEDKEVVDWLNKQN